MQQTSQTLADQQRYVENGPNGSLTVRLQSACAGHALAGYLEVHWGTLAALVVGSDTKVLFAAEFFTQGDKERKHGLPVTPILNRSTGHLASSQLAFVMYVTKPMMESLAPVLPDFVRKATTHMERTMALYQEIIAEGPSSRFKTIGVDYLKLVPPGSMITDDLCIES
jgi:3'5'-cyclic nucleotide phosphodiesterase